MPASVRRFSADEWRTYRDLRLRALKESPDAFGSTFDREVAMADDDWRNRLAAGVGVENQIPLVALVDGTPAGLAWGRVSDDDPDVAHLYQVWIAPEHRGRGLGRLVVETVVAWARASGLRALRLHVTADNSVALRLYRQLGFVEEGDTEPLRPGSALRSQAMQLVLDAERSTNS